MDDVYNVYGVCVIHTGIVVVLEWTPPQMGVRTRQVLGLEGGL